MNSRCIALIDMDCFYVQVEERLQPQNRGLPGAVVQYTGGLIAVNYEARDLGIKRGMRPSEAKKLCPNIILYRVPEVRKKADLNRYRQAGSEVLKVFCSFGAIVEKASIDESYIDLTDMVAKSDLKVEYLGNAFIEGLQDNTQFLRNINWDEKGGDCYLSRGAAIMMDMRAKVLEVTEFTCSAGIAHNKVVAKLAAGLHKPNKLTVIPQSSVRGVFETVSVGKVRSLGGKLGQEIVSKLDIETMAQLADVSSNHLMNLFGSKTGMWLHELSHGYEYEPVENRLLGKSIGCAKNFPGKSALSSVQDVTKWVNNLCEELEERLAEDKKVNHRVPRHLVISIGVQSKSTPLFSNKLNLASLYKSVMSVLNKFNTSSSVSTSVPSSGQWTPPIGNLQLSATKFEAIESSGGIEKYIQSSGSAAPPASTGAIARSMAMAMRLNILMSKDEEKISFEDKY